MRSQRRKSWKQIIFALFLSAIGCILVLVSIFFDPAPNKIKLAKAAESSAGQYLKLNGGYGELTDDNFTDLDYTKDFSIETVVDISDYENANNRWPGIIGKAASNGLYAANGSGWALGLYSEQGGTAKLWAKVGDGTNQVSTGGENYLGRIHLITVWDVETRTLKMYLNGELVSQATKTEIVPASIKNANNLWIGRAYTVFSSPIIFIRLWNRDISNSASSLYANYKNTGQHELPGGFDRSNLLSEWLMFERSNASGGAGSTHIKDTAGSNNVELKNGAEIVSSAGNVTASQPANGATAQNKAIVLKAEGGFGTLELAESVKGPVQYYFQIDESTSFNTSSKKESGWIADLNFYQPILKPSTKYYWRVKVRDSNNTPRESAYSAISSFTTEGPTTWFVRPEGGNYGAENGTSYANAWDGLEKVVWGEAGVEAGDTLYVAGLHYKTVSTYDSGAGSLELNASGYSSEYPITIRGDYASDSGVIWGGYDIRYAPWTSEGNGVYRITLTGSHGTGNYFQDVTKTTATQLTLKNSSAEVAATPGSFYLSGSTLYVKTTDGGNPTGRIFLPTLGYKFAMGTDKYIKFLNFGWYRPTWNCYEAVNQPGTCTHIRWEGLKTAYGGHSIFPFTNGMDYMEVVNCDISYASNGIYTISGDNNAPSYFLFKGNTIHDIAVRPEDYNNDGHCVGVQGGYNGVVEDNYCFNTQVAMGIYTYTNQESKNNIFRRNIVKDCHTITNQSAYGIMTMLNNDSMSDKNGNQFYQNMVINCNVGYRMQFEDEQRLFNNLAYNCNTGIAGSRSIGSLAYQNASKIFVTNQIVTGSQSGASAKVRSVDPFSSASGQFSVANLAGDFVNGENLLVDGVVYGQVSGTDYLVGPNIWLRNNVLMGTKVKHIDVATGAVDPYTKLDSNYNLFTPDGNMFNYKVSGNYSIWKASGRETNSPAPTDPKFVNSSGSFSQVGDFAPAWNSPVIDTGVEVVGLSTDYNGDPIYGTPDIGPIEYQPPYKMGTNAIDKEAKVRIYADGKYRNKVQPSGTTIDLNIAPAEGFASADYRQWMDLEIITWNVSGDYIKKWTEESSIIGDKAVVHTVGNLSREQNYNVYYTKTGGVKIKLATIKAGVNNQIDFWYNQGFSKVTFEIEATSEAETEAQGEAPVSDTETSSTGSGTGSSSGSTGTSGSGNSSSNNSGSDTTSSSGSNSVSGNSSATAGDQSGSVSGSKNGTSQQSSNLYGSTSEIVETVANDEAGEIMAHNSFVQMNAEAIRVYEKLGVQMAKLAMNIRYRIAYFIQNSTKNTSYLGAGERGGVINSFKAAFGRFPETTIDWQDVIKIGNGRWPSQKNLTAEEKAKIEFKKIYLRTPDMNNANDNAAVTVITYGLRPARRNFDSEKQGVIIFKGIYGHNPTSASDWDIVRAIAYSGAKR